MKKVKIKFSNNRNLFFIPDLNSYILAENELKCAEKCSKKWSSDGITGIYIYFSSIHPQKRILEIQEQLIQSKFDVTLVNLDEFQKENFAYFHDINNRIQKNLKNGSGAFIFSKEDQDAVESLIVSLMLSIKNKKPVPVNSAISYITGVKSELCPGLNWIHKFSDYICVKG